MIPKVSVKKKFEKKESTKVPLQGSEDSQQWLPGTSTTPIPWEDGRELPVQLSSCAVALLW